MNETRPTASEFQASRQAERQRYELLQEGVHEKRSADEFCYKEHFGTLNESWIKVNDRNHPTNGKFYFDLFIYRRPLPAEQGAQQQGQQQWVSVKDRLPTREDAYFAPVIPPSPNDARNCSAGLLLIFALIYNAKVTRK